MVQHLRKILTPAYFLQCSKQRQILPDLSQNHDSLIGALSNKGIQCKSSCSTLNPEHVCRHDHSKMVVQRPDSWAALTSGSTEAARIWLGSIGPAIQVSFVMISTHALNIAASACTNRNHRHVTVAATVLAEHVSIHHPS